MRKFNCDHCGAEAESRFPHTRACSEECRVARRVGYQRVKQLEYYHKRKRARNESVTNFSVDKRQDTH